MRITVQTVHDEEALSIGEKSFGARTLYKFTIEGYSPSITLLIENNSLLKRLNIIIPSIFVANGDEFKVELFASTNGVDNETQLTSSTFAGNQKNHLTFSIPEPIDLYYLLHLYPTINHNGNDYYVFDILIEGI